ncbi:MAG: Alpha/beta hydrolase [Ilumatobacteraceae bacterium]|nr:Alpha/beta hydrolase [Ilumatobacteraceae bacterium]
MPSEPIPVLADAPGWFRRALAIPFEDGSVTVDGAHIHFVAWGQPGRRGLVFVHGGAAHAHWWTHIAATFAAQFRVVAIDLSGHGDSHHRDRYTLEHWTDEVIAVTEAAGIAGKPVVIGHSMGGMVTIATAAMHPDSVEGVIICDSPVTSPDPEVNAHRSKDAFGKPRTYATVDEALARFRTVPEQRNDLDYVIDHVARRSLRAADGGWQWKFDRRIFDSFEDGMRSIAKPYLSEITCRFALLRSEYGLVTPGIGAEMYDDLGRNAPVIEIPQAGHHAMLDQPLLLLTAVRTLLADWDHSEPHRSVSATH